MAETIPIVFEFWRSCLRTLDMPTPDICYVNDFLYEQALMEYRVSYSNVPPSGFSEFRYNFFDQVVKIVWAPRCESADKKEIV